MTWVHQTIADFGTSIGIKALALDSDGKVELSWGSNADIAIQHLSGEPREILVSIARPLENDFGRHLRNALRTCDYRMAELWTPHAYVQDEKIALTLRLPERAFTLSALEHALSIIMRWHGSVSNTI